MKIKTIIAASLISVPLLAGPAVAIGVPPLPQGEIGVGLSIPPSPVPLPDLTPPSDSPKGEVGREGASREAKRHCKHDYDCDGVRDEIGGAEVRFKTPVLPHTGAGENVGLALAGVGLIALGGIAYSISKRQDR